MDDDYDMNLVTNLISGDTQPTDPTPKPAKRNNTEPSKNKKWSKQQQGGGNREQRGTTRVVSSIFSHNPDLPTVKTKPIKPIVERIFDKQRFGDLSLHPYLVSHIETALGLTQLTAVQRAAIPVILSKSDALVKSQTGSGKTLAYAVPIIQMLQAIEPKVQRNSGVYALAVLPTRELVIQTYECFQKLVKPFVRIVPGCLMGGNPRHREKAAIRKGLNIIVTTPARLLDHIRSTKVLQFSKLQWLVLDEADQLMDLGYERDVASILSTLKEQRTGEGDQPWQTIMLSATLTQRVETLAGLALFKPRIVDIAVETHATDVPDSLVTPDSLDQRFVYVPTKLRLVTLAAFLIGTCSEPKSQKAIVFMSTQDEVDYHMDLFRMTLHDAVDDDNEFSIMKLHGNMTQQDRSEVFQQFRDSKSGVLLTTDVAARGLDVPHVDWIVQYSAPSSPAIYVHRVGRTARIGHHGAALLFLLPSEQEFLGLLHQSGLRVEEVNSADVLSQLCSREAPIRKKSQQRGDKHPLPRIQQQSTNLQLKFENAVLNNQPLLDSARKAFLSYTRSYASYPTPLKKMLPFKSLHLGHVAKSLALRDTPSELGVMRPSAPQKRQHEPEDPEAVPKKRRYTTFSKQPLALTLSEFDSGLDASGEPPKRSKITERESRKDSRKRSFHP